MNVMICLLRGVNLGGHHKVPMEVLRTLCESLKCQDVQTYVQSGNVVFRTSERDPAALGKKIENVIEKKFGFRADVVVRTPSELREVIARNPFKKRSGIEPGKLLVTFLATDPGPEIRNAVLEIKTNPEEVHLSGRELFIYYPDGQGRSKLWAKVDKALRNAGTARNWNTVTKLLEIAEKLGGGRC
jgi:uncharacterized protein (DUF1697 family)